MGYQPVKCPVLGMPGRTGTGYNQPLYLSMAAAVRLVDLLIPAQVDRATRKRMRERMREQARAQEQSSRGVRHQVGGTGSGAPPSNQAL